MVFFLFTYVIVVLVGLKAIFLWKRGFLSDCCYGLHQSRFQNRRGTSSYKGRDQRVSSFASVKSKKVR